MVCARHVAGTNPPIPINIWVLSVPSGPGKEAIVLSFRFTIEFHLSERTIQTFLYVAVLLIRWYFGH